VIFHITTRAEWAAAQAAGLLAPASLQREGFVHASTLAQVLRSGERWFAGQDGLVLLEIEPQRAGAELRWEDLQGEGQPFPHLYGPVPLAAITAAHPLARGPDGRLRLPPGLG
jgi:uncharacterized protein (DUF952 family)